LNRTHAEPGGAGVRRELGVYLNDHLAGATAGTELVRRLAASVSEPEVREPLRKLAAEVAEDRAALLEIMKILGFRVQRYKARAGWIAERVGRLKSNGRIVRRSPLSSLLELEMLRLAVEGKAACWRTLQELTDLTDGVASARLDELLSRAGRQAEALEKLRVQAARNLRSEAPAHAGRP
jgi:hypothetical protein